MADTSSDLMQQVVLYSCGKVDLQFLHENMMVWQKSQSVVFSVPQLESTPDNSHLLEQLVFASPVVPTSEQAGSLERLKGEGLVHASSESTDSWRLTRLGMQSLHPEWLLTNPRLATFVQPGLKLEERSAFEFVALLTRDGWESRPLPIKMQRRHALPLYRPGGPKTWYALRKGSGASSTMWHYLLCLLRAEDSVS